MLRLFWIFVIISTSAGEIQGTKSRHYLNGAMTGFDPHISDILKQPNPGRKSQIFQPLGLYDQENILYQNIQEIEETKCIPEFSHHKIRNYDEYKSFLSSAYEFASRNQCDETFEPPPNFQEVESPCDKNNPNVRELAMEQFFKDLGGEAHFVTTVCITHTVNIAPIVKPTFTKAFLAALENVDRAVQNSSPKSSETAFIEFIKSYGTHFASMTHLGAKSIFGKLFSQRVTTTFEEKARHRCMMESAYEALTPGTRRNNETTLSHFSRATAERCGGKDEEVMVVAEGPLPENSLNDWADAAKLNPKPIYYKLEKISSMFSREWFSTVNQESSRSLAGGLLNGTELNSYFEDKLTDYCTTMFGQTCPPRRGCGYNDLCGAGTKCIDAPNTASEYECVDIYGGIIIAGGVRTTTNEGWGIDIPPNLPASMEGNTLSIVGSQMYNCGGYTRASQTVCYVLTPGDTAWRRIRIPWPLGYHSAVTISEEIWFFYKSKLHIYQTSLSKFRTFNMIFHFEKYFCAVTNGSHTFVIGAGKNKDEVWMNHDILRPSEWEKFTELSNKREMHACLWLGSAIYVSGGTLDSRTAYTSSVEVIDVSNKTIRSTSPLVQQRRHHMMAVLDSKPAVLGGYAASRYLATIETYDIPSNTWESLNFTMETARRAFGLAQLRT